MKKNNWRTASYTVEAAWILGICLTIVCSTILLGYRTFSETLTAVEKEEREVDAVSLFRKGDVWEQWKQVLQTK